jgi:hypothetical protein
MHNALHTYTGSEAETSWHSTTTGITYALRPTTALVIAAVSRNVATVTCLS